MHKIAKHFNHTSILNQQATNKLF